MIKRQAGGRFYAEFTCSFVPGHHETETPVARARVGMVVREARSHESVTAAAQVHVKKG